MREIKFRGKRVDNGEWMYGNPVEWLNETKDISIVAHPFGCCIDEKGNLVLIEAPFVCKIIPETIGQFTGLHDNKGKEIYEGDIVEYKDFSNGMYLFKEQPKARGTIKIDNLLNGIYLKGMGTFEGNKAEIIGNIHDNPELLKEASHEA